MDGTDDRDQPFEDVTLNSDFVKGAARRELTASERLAAISERRTPMSGWLGNDALSDGGAVLTDDCSDG